MNEKGRNNGEVKKHIFTNIVAFYPNTKDKARSFVVMKIEN